MINTFIAILISAGPAIAAIAGSVVAYLKNKKIFTNLKDAIVDTKEYNDVKEQLKIAYQENYELKLRLDTLIKSLNSYTAEVVSGLQNISNNSNNNVSEEDVVEDNIDNDKGKEDE